MWRLSFFKNEANGVSDAYGIVPVTSLIVLHEIFFSLLAILFLTACYQQANKEKEDVILPASSAATIYKTIGDIKTPEGYERIPSSPGSFTAWLRKVPLKSDKTVYLYNGKLKPNQSAQFAVIDIPVGTKDLQQCADAVMRLRAEYLFAEKQYAAISFMDYNGKWYRWNGGNNRTAFDNYLQNVFGWCGSASLEKQLRPISQFSTMAPGDVLVKGGFPGHAMMVADMAVNKKGEKIYMLAQGYQPAQDIHIVINPADSIASLWYKISDNTAIITPEWIFEKSNLERW